MFPNNKLLDALPGADRTRLLAQTREVDLSAGHLLPSKKERISRVYFPTSTYVSMQVAAPGSRAEVMVTGFEGAIGAQLALGGGTYPLDSLIQADGTALELDARDFERQMQTSDAFYSIMQAYVGAMIQKISISCGCLQAHPLDERLARRLLVTHDCARRSPFHVTHDFLAHVLGVRRAGVSGAAARLQRRGIIEYTRGEVRVVDRAALESTSCTCYAATCRAYAQAMKRERDGR
jgi:CRP-like cAMP-binding protein